MPHRVKERVERCRGSGRLQAFRYTDVDPETGALRALFCKCCGRKIYGERPWGNPETRILNPADGAVETRTVILTQKVILAPLPGYTTMTIEFDDGTAHTTPCCEGCAQEPKTPEDLEAIYAADLAALEEEFTRDGGDSTAFMQSMGLRKPVRWLKGDAVQAGRRVVG